MTEAERLIAASGVPYAILRPGFVIAPSAYGGSAMLRALAALPVALPAKETATPFQPVASEDLAATIFELMGIDPSLEIWLSQPTRSAGEGAAARSRGANSSSTSAKRPSRAISTTAVATATFACITLVSEFATAPAPVASESAMFARVVSESAAALVVGCSRVFNERGETGMRDAGGSTFAAILVDFAFFMARWALSRT